jgi:hypothetical protein
MIPANLLSRLYTMGLALLAFGAFYRPAFLGSLAASPGTLLIAICVMMLPLTRVHRSYASSQLFLKYLLLLGVLTSVGSVWFFGLSGVYAAKFITLGLLALVWLSPLLMLDIMKIEHLRSAVLAALGICLLAFLVSDLMQGLLPDAVRQLIFGGEYAEIKDGRARGFTEEASHFAALLGRFSLIYYLIWEAKRPYSGPRLLLVLGTVAVALVLLGSKGAALSIALAMVAAGASWRHKYLLVLLVPAAGFVIHSQMEALVADWELFSSASTRLGMAVAGLMAIASNPLGYGYYGFYGAVQHFGLASMDWLSGYVPLAFGEMSEIIEELTAVSLKSTLLDLTVTFGWAFLLLLWKVVRLINMKDARARGVLAYMLLTSLSTSGHASITFFLGLAVLIKLYPAARAAKPAYLQAQQVQQVQRG